MTTSHRITITIPLGLTASRIERANPSIDKATAQVLALELHELVGLVRKSCHVRPLGGDYAASEVTDLAETVYRTALNVWPADRHAGDLESIWIAERFIVIDAEDGLYDRYLDVCSKISGEDLRIDPQGLMPGFIIRGEPGDITP
jgi:hypothetical protein